MKLVLVIFVVCYPAVILCFSRISVFQRRKCSQVAYLISADISHSLLPHIAIYRHIAKASQMTTMAMNRCTEYADIIENRSRWGGRVIGPILRYLNNFTTGILFTILLRIMNRFKSFRRETLLQHVFHRPAGKGLLTVSNHQSILDDPGLWGAILPFWRIRPEQLRWSLCTEDVFFYVSTNASFKHCCEYLCA